MACSNSFLASQIPKIENAINAAMDAELALITGGIQSYTIDTGQDRQTVNKQNITELRNYIDGLYNRYVTLVARVDGCGVSIARPCW